MTDPIHNAPSIAQVALRGLCPKCGTTGLFSGLVAFTPKCKSCGLDISSFNVGDGPAIFLIFLISIIDFAGIIIVSLAYNPPWWVHALLWLPLTVALTIGLLRLSKAALLASEYRNAARQGTLSK